MRDKILSMTREQILNMESTELSLAVAEHIFQAKTIGSENIPDVRLLVGWFGQEAWKPLKGTWRSALWRQSDEEAWLDCPKYTEDISAAWEVVEHLNGEYSFTIQRLGSYFDDHPDYGWEAVFTTNENIKVIAKTAPEAICKAALLVVLELEDIDSTESPSEAAAERGTS